MFVPTTSSPRVDRSLATTRAHVNDAGQLVKDVSVPSLRIRHINTHRTTNVCHPQLKGFDVSWSGWDLYVCRGWRRQGTLVIVIVRTRESINRQRTRAMVSVRLHEAIINPHQRGMCFSLGVQPRDTTRNEELCNTALTQYLETMEMPQQVSTMM